MAQIQLKPIESKSEWEKFLQTRTEANFLHSFNWGTFHQALGKTVIRIGFYKANQLIGVMQGIVEKAKRATYLTIPGGPLINWDNEQVVAAFMQNVKTQAKQNNCSFVRVRPQIPENSENRELFCCLGFKKSPMHLHVELTVQLDLTKTEDELLASMRKNTRYEIKKALKMGIKIEKSTNLKDVENFYELQAGTAKRQKFVPFSKPFLVEQFKAFSQDNQAVLYTAKHEGSIINQAFVIYYGQEADYHYGASTQEARRLPGAYLMQWEAIKEAKKRGMKRYDLWGVAPEEEKNHRFYGVSVFKRGFRGQELHYLGTSDLVINPIKYKLNWVVEVLRKKSRGL